MQGQIDKYCGLFVAILVNNIFNVLVLAVFFLFGTVYPPINLPALLFFAGAGFLTSFLGRVLLFSSIEYIGPSRAGTLKITAPLFTVAFGVLLLREKISGPAYIGIALILAGAYFISREYQSLKSPAAAEEAKIFSSGRLYRIGLVLAVLAGVSLGSGNVLRKVGVTHYSQPLIGVTIGSLTALLVMLAVFAWQQRLVEVVRKVPSMLRGGGYLWTGVLTSLALYTTFTALLFSPVSMSIPSKPQNRSLQLQAACSF